MCYQFYDNYKILSFGHHFKEVKLKNHICTCPFLRVSQKSEKNLYGLGNAVSTLRTFV